ncbi:sn-1-specific diacylglycerol lipase ABHD11 isoform X2 [Euwallacea fornicatus]|uniref:sn-1-specific diacylglycerol lipase ABHD11 isoform X2 n=1 Tax=Euwallacea fornicatus TaxID=995702 RepID=UPI00338D6746
MLSPGKLKILKVLKRNSQRFSTTITPEPIKLAHAVYEQETVSDNQVNPFIIAHGLLGSKQNWTSLCKAYTQKFNPPRKVIALDLRNHGESTHSDEHTYNHLVEDVKQFLIDNNISKAALMGHSMGGRCAMLFALKYPEFLEKLVVVDISPVNLSPNIHEMPIILDTMRRVQMPSNVPLSQSRNIINEQLKKVITDKGIRAFILTNLTAVGDNKSYKWRVNIPTLLKQFKEIAKFDTVEGLQYKGETLFIGGAKSDYIPRSDFPKILQLFPNAELKYIEGAGHWVHAEKPSEFLKITMEFLNKTAEV